MIPQIEGLYLLHTFTCISNNQSIYKIGRSNNLYKRISSYSNGSICYLVIECLDSKNDEAAMIKLFNKKYKNIKFYGKEYFEGYKNDMLQTIKTYVNDKYNYPRIIDDLFYIMIHDKNNCYLHQFARIYFWGNALFGLSIFPAEGERYLEHHERSCRFSANKI
jgi:hypothetical protein